MESHQTKVDNTVEIFNQFLNSYFPLSSDSVITNESGLVTTNKQVIDQFTRLIDKYFPSEPSINGHKDGDEDKDHIPENFNKYRDLFVDIMKISEGVNERRQHCIYLLKDARKGFVDLKRECGERDIQNYNRLKIDLDSISTIDDMLNEKRCHIIDVMKKLYKRSN